MPAQAAFTFAGFRLEPAERRLIGPAGPVPLPPKAFDLLVILVANAGRLLRKEDLMEQLWPGVFVEEVNLAQNVSAVRRALGGEDRKAFIETVAGSGYRFAAPVQVEQNSVGVGAAERPPRLIVLPFRLLTPDPDIGFLSFSVADALSASLAELDTIVVRSSLTAAKYTNESGDLTRLARETDVNLVVSGTIARAGDELRVTVQLCDAGTGRLIWSCAETGGVGRLFTMHDALVARIVESIARPLSAREERRLRGDVPRSARAYEYYLRGNHASADSDWPVARDLYLQAIEEDASFAPSWARLARVYRLIAKYRPEAGEAAFARAEQALARALLLNPELSMAHSLGAQMDTDRGEAESAMVRLLARAAVRPSDADTYSGLVYVCRCCGLLDASLRAHERAHHLDETLATSVMQTLFVLRRYDDVLAAHGLIKGYVYVISLSETAGPRAALDAGLQVLMEGTRVAPLVRAACAMFENRRDDSLAILADYVKTITDPDGLYYVARHSAHLDDARLALDSLGRSIDGGYACHSVLATDPWLDSIRRLPEFEEWLERARRRHAHAKDAFDRAGGSAILGLPRA